MDHIPILKVDNFLLVTIQVELHDDLAMSLLCRALAAQRYKGFVRTLRKLRFYSMRLREHEPSGVVSSMKIVPLKQELRMDKSMIKGIAVGGIAMVVLGAGAVTGYKTMTKPEFAEVVAAKEILETVVTPREKCEDVQVQHQASVKDEHRIAGTLVGGLAGGLLGSAVGGGNGKTLATVAGAAAGGYAGNRVQKNMQEKDVTTTTEHRCKTVNEKSQKVVGYNVTYRLDGKDGVERMSFKPGPTLPVKDGRVVTTRVSDTKS